MQIFDGSFDNAIKSQEDWLTYPHRRSEGKLSFSQVLFDYLNLPQHKTEDYANLTMHQILRLIYVDQITPPTKILKEDAQFDNRNVRRAISEMLLGLDDLDAYQLRQEHIRKTKVHDELRGQISAISKFLQSSDGTLGREKAIETINEFEENKIKLQDELKTLRDKKETTGLGDKNEKAMEDTRSVVIDLQERIIFFKRTAHEIEAEIFDSEKFIGSLSQRLKSLHESDVTFNTLGQITFQYCPICLSPIESANEFHCHLCKSPKKNDEVSVAHLQMKNELEFQIRESKKILDSRSADLIKVRNQIPGLESRLRSVRDKLVSQTQTTDEYEFALVELSEKIGYLTKAIEDYNEKLSHIAQLDQKIDQLRVVMEEISAIAAKLESIKLRGENRVDRVTSDLESSTLGLLRKDLQFEPDFENGETFGFDFDNDKMFLNGRSKFSASSMVILKNSFHLAIMLASVKDGLMRYPRLLLMDNVEDKGMQPERSHNFQQLIIDHSSNLIGEHQIIFTTSMIAPALNNTPYCVGPFYPKGQHTLVF